MLNKTDSGIFTCIRQDNVIGDDTFPICHNDNFEEFNRIIFYSNFAKIS